MVKKLLKYVINPKTGRKLKIDSKVINTLDYVIDPISKKKMKTNGKKFKYEQNLSKKFERCVKAVKAKSPHLNAWAICHASIKRKK